MYKHILIPTDGSELSARAVRNGIAFAKSIGARVTALTVTPPFHIRTVDPVVRETASAVTPPFRIIPVDPVVLTNVPEQYERYYAAAVSRALDVAKDAARVLGVTGDFFHVVHDQPHEAIIEAARKHGCDLIFMASHGRKGVSALLLGSEATKVLVHSKIPVLVCR